MHPTLMRTLALATLTAAAAAQTPNNLIGLTRATPIVNQRNHNACLQMPFCNPPGFPPALPQPYAGGTGWDPIRNGVWISNGALLAEVDPNGCNYICPPAPAPLVTPNAVVTGLEEVESLNEVWMLDSLGNLYRLSYSCPPAPLAVCNTGLPLTPTNATGGLAVDECNRLVFYSYSNWTTGATMLFVATIGLPCAPFMNIPVPGCAVPLRGVTGLAVDGCRQVLYLTDGVTTIGWSYNVLPGPVVAFGALNCCVLPPPVPGDTFVGLAVRSGGATSNLLTCANGACPVCPMIHTLRNSPNLGNAQFGLDLNGAPLGSLFWCIIGVGPCMPAGPVPPPFCGPFFTGPTLGTLGPSITPPGVGCGGFATFNLPLPVIPSFCGAVLSSQVVGICPAGGLIGTTMSNCLSWELQSN